MIKRIIFDVDDTLIPWDTKYYKLLKTSLKEHGIEISNFRFYLTLRSIEKYERNHDCWNIEEFKEYISKVSKIQMDDDKINIFLKWLENCIIGTASKSLHDTLKYLAKKYELVILSNSIKTVQVIRLEKYGIKHYFKEIYCGDEIMKPNKKAYINACGKYKTNECMMIGDNFNFDVVEPSKLGIKSIYVNKKKHKKYLTISDVTELKEIL